ncbi:E3 ubiquitin-protein ligase TRIM56-like [Diadema antillarum]|uniref:E3 ubiquitin-protein ligase TRIM56-like n=1 Tax=Diadema antillarum TaxID=105358 RepID=UPI003A8B7776
MASFHQIMTNDLRCPICLTMHKEPKSLSCAHTFCLDCLEQLHKVQDQQKTMSCPVCRKQTRVPSEGLSQLQTSMHLKAVVDDVKISMPTCTNCAPAEESAAAVYCQDCSALMCVQCEMSHAAWKAFSKHTVVDVTDIQRGNVPLKGRCSCSKHHTEVEDHFCPVCRKYICFRCGVLEHGHKGNNIIAAIKHEESLTKSIKELESKKEERKTALLRNNKAIETNSVILQEAARKVIADVEKAYADYSQLLEDRKKTLMDHIGQLFAELDKDLRGVAEENRKALVAMDTVQQFIGKATDAPLEEDALSAHNTLREILESILQRSAPDDSKLTSVMERASRIKFHEGGEKNKPNFGVLRDWRHKWIQRLKSSNDVVLP